MPGISRPSSRAAAPAEEDQPTEPNGVWWAFRNAHPALLALYYSNSFLTAFPVLAMADWLNNGVRMSVSTQSQFYAFIFMPYCFKPVYAVAANALGKHRRIDKRSRACLLLICRIFLGSCTGTEVLGGGAVR